MISLVMTTYNGLKYISEQLESIKNQTVLPDEVLIYDDRSTDGTYEYVQEYIQTNKLDEWNVVRNKENKGYSLNFSDAMKESHGDIVFLCDQDDIWHLDKIKVMSEIMNSHPEIELLASNVHPFYMGEHPQRVHYQKYKGDLIKIRRLGEWIKPARPGCTMCFRRTLMKNYQSLWFREYPHDCLLWGLAVLQGKAYIYNRETIEFRRHDSNASSQGGYDVNYRIRGIENEIRIINQADNYFELHDLKLHSFLRIQKRVYEKRKDCLINTKLISSVMMVRYLRYYGQTRFWMTDLYYVLKNKHK